MNRSHPHGGRLTRRQFLTTTAATAGLSLAGAGLRPARAQSKIGFAGWAFEPQVVEANVKRFTSQNPDIAVTYTPLDLQLYEEKMVALFNASTQPDAFYVRDTALGAWVEAGWLQPIDGGPPRQVTRFISDRIFDYDVAPDGALVCARGAVVSDVVTIRGFPRRSR